MIILDILIIISLFSFFAVSHTVLASLKIKKQLKEKIGDKIAFYRLFYNISSLAFFIGIYELSPKPDVIIYELQNPYDIITFAFQVLSLFGFLWAVKPISLMNFAGITQIEKFFKGNYNADELDEKLMLKIEGAYKYMRHPVYFFSILFLGFRPTMDLYYFVIFICITVYFYIGAIYEEKKLIEVFGETYREYQRNVNRIFPGKSWYPGKNNNL